MMYDFLKLKNPKSKVLKEIGAPIKSKNKVTLPYYMGSMDKIKPPSNKLEVFKNKYKGIYILTDKLDGVSGLLVYNDDIKLAGSIDMVYENPDGTLSIYDWKRVKEISRINAWNKYAITRSICQMPDSNFWHYSLQLNTYKAILEAKYEKKVTDLYLVRLHPDAEETNYELIKVPDLSADIQTLLLNLTV